MSDDHEKRKADFVIAQLRHAFKHLEDEHPVAAKAVVASVIRMLERAQ